MKVNKKVNKENTPKDKPAHLGGPWDETRLPHEEIASE